MRTALVFLFALAGGSCRCSPNVAQVEASLAVKPEGLDFGPVKVGQMKSLTLKFEAASRAPVLVSSLSLEGSGASAFSLSATSLQIEALQSTTITVSFSPPVAEAMTAALVIVSNDAKRPVLKVALAGEGAFPRVDVTTDCPSSRGCMGTVNQDPLNIDFGQEPLVRQLPLDASKLPAVVIVNVGVVPLQLMQLTTSGSDAAAFTIAGNATVPPEGVTLDPGSGVNVPLRFVPTSQNQIEYAAMLRLDTDDPSVPQVEVALHGTLAPNRAPIVCANLIRVVPQLEAPRDYDAAMYWSPLLLPPPSGYDFTLSRDVRPNELVVFSAHSNNADVTSCSTDPDDGRTGLTYEWQVIEAPQGAEGLALAGAATSQAQLRPIAQGEYGLELTVTDAQHASATVRMRFAVAAKQDLVAQLDWAGFSGIDLDLHLVRPNADTGSPFSGAFQFFESGVVNKTSGDLNGFSKRTQTSNPGAGYDFDWGLPGSADDPSLNLDARGDGQLLENISLNSPENDAPCATSPCTYRVMVHYFNDARVIAGPADCAVDGGTSCRDGDRCTCDEESRCVAQAAPPGSVATGPGKCYPGPKAVVRLFVKGSPTAAAVIPLDTLMPVDAMRLGSPCTMWHVADVVWPAKSALGSLPDGGTPPPTISVIGTDSEGRLTAPALARFGRRQSGSLQCSPDTSRSGVDWYAQQP